MRTLMLVSVLMVVAAPLAAQTQVNTRAPQKEVRAQDVPIKSVEDLRLLKGQIDELKLRNIKNDSMWRIEIEKKGDPRRIQLLLDELDRNSWPLLAKQSQLALACAELRGPFAGWIGVAFEREARWTKDPVTDRITMNFFGRPKVAEIEAGSPAEQAGVQSGDEWLALNGRSIDDSVEFNELDKPGVSVSIRTARVGKLLDVVVKIGKRPFIEDVCDEQPKPIFTTFPPLVRVPGRPERVGPGTVQIIRPPGAASRLFVTSGQITLGGAILRALDDDQREVLKVRDGVLVTEVGAATPAAAAGIKSLDVVVVVNGVPVKSLLDFQRAMWAEPVLTMTLHRAGKEVLVKMPVK